jgi:hypothetical protein
MPRAFPFPSEEATLPPLTRDAWLTRLEADLAAQQRRIKRPTDYYDGNHRLQFATAKYRDAFGSLFAAFADNWCQLVVDAAVDRLEVQGFRFGGKRETDDDAWSIWQANNLDAESEKLHSEAVKCGCAYTLVDPADGATPRITIEHPSQVIVAHAAGDRRVRLAALKKWLDESGYVFATLYLPEAVYKYQSHERVKSNAVQKKITWVPRADDPGGANPLGVVPVVPFYNRPTMLGGGRSDLEPAYALQDAITKLALDMIVASEFGAFMQRWATGVDIPKDEATGRPLNPTDWIAGAGKLWAVASPDAKFGTFQATDLQNFVIAIDMFVQHLAAQTRTPPHYLLAKLINVSGDALKIGETGLVSRVRSKHRHLGEGHEETMRLAFRAGGDQADDRRARSAVCAAAGRYDFGPRWPATRPRRDGGYMRRPRWPSPTPSRTPRPTPIPSRTRRRTRMPICSLRRTTPTP